MYFSSVIEEETSEVEWTTGSASVIEGVGVRVRGGGS
jgi:hypothetical protein